MSNISLTASMRSNLLSLQNTQKLMDQTQERLSTGNKVNSAIDNPSSYYTAQALNNRASDLSALLDSMGQAIQTIKAADEGIKAITEFAEQAKAVAQSASDTSDEAERTNYMNQFNAILGQINAVAKDSGYKGVNLLNGDSLTVKFSENDGSSLTITGEKALTTETTGLNVGTAADWGTDGTKITASIKAVETAISTLRSWSSKFGNNYSIVQSREAFTENLINVLTEGADKLTLADMNEESANMLALQTRQQLAINSLSLASQAAQSVLRLF
ncbi:MAG: flagellin [Alphaproteobacteria bacterium]|nr:flagellin [Alphaproteobacteria bacterium]